ncbi:DedA family protein [Paeniglutamicibacter antarcticus]|uniref:DedA family protein n=1 Tax=Arthrobacter terrae TaxID=2935737 RepID=A0A931CVF9_9MICC|nr:DedA family protein [Arthrobacter terrae]MBG0741691.1 DedA family protein [Arthrobacter terrae]
MGAIIDNILGINVVLASVIVFALVFAEDAFFLGFVIPGETAAILGGVLASRGHIDLWSIMALVIAAAIIGDTVGYEVGRIFGTRILKLRILARKKRHLDRAQNFLRRRGGTAVFLGRFTAFFRAVMPALSGTAGMSYRKFLLFNATGGIIWGTATVTLGFLAGNSYKAVAKTAGSGTAILVATIVVALLVIWRVRKRRAEKTVAGSEGYCATTEDRT